MALAEEVLSSQAPPVVENENPTPTPNPRRKNVLLPAVIIFIVVLLAIGAILIFSPKTQISKSDQALNKELEKGKILLAKQIAKVGDEILYGKDLSFYFYQIDRPSFTKTNEQEVKNTILATLVEQSIILQAASKMNLVKLSNDVFNNLDKNQPKRIQLFNQAYAALQEQESKYSGEVIAVWYYDQQPAKIPAAQAETLAKQKIDALHAQIQAGTLTMKEAGEQIRNDTQLQSLDINYKANSIYSFTDAPLPEASSFPLIQSEVAKMQAGTVSEVIKIDEPGQKLFVVISLTKKTPGEIENFNTWLDNEKKQYPVKIY